MSDCRFGVSPVNYPDPDSDNRLIVEVELSLWPCQLTFKHMKVAVKWRMIQEYNVKP